jgi:hypothetical protein
MLILGLDRDQDPHSSKRLELDPHIMNADPKHCSAYSKSILINQNFDSCDKRIGGSL